MIVRHEAWGAWVKLESMPALVALDHAGVAALGVDRPKMVPAARRPLEVHLAVTSRCGAGCEGCYTNARADGTHVATARLLESIRGLAHGGAFAVALGGGEPTLHDDLDVLAREAKRLGVTPVVTTSGLGLTEAKIDRLREFAQVNVSYDGRGETFAAVRGYAGAEGAERAITRLVEHGIRVGVDVVLTRATFPALTGTLRHARALGASEAQLLRFKPGGRTTTLDYLAHKLRAEQVLELPRVLSELTAEHAPSFRLRIDCSMVPLLAGDRSITAARLEALGVLGCVAGDELAAITAGEMVAPCSFLPATTQPASSIGEGLDDAAFAPYRAWERDPDAPCASCDLRPVCRGGCKAVTLAVDGVIGPDPDCPRVASFRERNRRAPAPPST
ncbi:mycofactocin radical SAM maturase [soil metagenome]